MKRTKVLTAILMVCLIAFSSIYTVFAAVYIEDWGFRFEKVNNGSAYEINKYLGDTTDVTIPNQYNGFRIISVGEYAFVDTSVTSVVLGDNITEIKNSAFINVVSLESIVFDKNLNTIGNLAFSGCTGLNNITIPDSVTEIADNAFSNCGSIVIHCNTGSYAQEYAKSHSIPYVLTDTSAPTEPPTEEPTAAPTEAPTTAPTEAPTLEPTEAPTEAIVSIFGDADGNGVIEVDDATFIQRVIAELPVPYPMETLMQGDVDGDGELTITDATLIQRYVAEMPVNYPIGEPIAK